MGELVAVVVVLAVVVAVVAALALRPRRGARRDDTLRAGRTGDPSEGEAAHRGVGRALRKTGGFFGGGI